jgi:aminoglycoside phosphotransferase (APT) family kinase protein
VGKVAGLLDFDLAASGRPVWDLAMTARYWVPLRDPTSAAKTQREHLDPFARVRTLLDAYGADDETRRDFTAISSVAIARGLGTTETSCTLGRAAPFPQ